MTARTVAASTSGARAREARHPGTVGLLYAVAAYAWWGAVPLYWKALVFVPAAEILAHRIVWGFAVFALLLWARGRVSELAVRAREPWTLGFFALSAALLAANWLTFIYAVATERVLQTSLGYFLNPTVSVVLGMVVMGERLRPAQWAAVALGAAGVLQLATQSTEMPWIALVLALTFGFYGLVRKTAPIGALPGSTLETALAVPLALAYLGHLWVEGTAHFARTDLTTDLLLASTGLITAAPLLWFANAARRLPLSTIGFVQYLAPTGQLLLAVAVFGEPFTALHLRTFACIWAGVAVFTLESWLRSRHCRRAGSAASG